MTTIFGARVPGGGPAVDVTVRDGMIVNLTTHEDSGHIGHILSADHAPAAPGATEQDLDAQTIDAQGRWIIPGLWDFHTHFTQWSQTFGRLDLTDAHSAHEAMRMLRDHLAARRAGGLDPDVFVVGMRFRHASWADDEQPTLAAIDAASGGQPVVLSSVDMHCGWVNSAAARRLGVEAGASGLVGELQWFDVYRKLDNAPGAREEARRLVTLAERDAAGKGVVGIRDYEMADNIDAWTNRFALNINHLRVEAGVYPDSLPAAIDAGWHTGDVVPGSDGLGHIGPMKLISDGSLNTRSAYCSTPYSGIDAVTYGTLSYTPQRIEELFRLATDHGFAIACHAIGDEANTIVLNAAEATHAHGSIEHAQLLKPSDIPRFAALGLDASIQPEHAVDDRDVIPRFWANATGIPYAFRSLKAAGARLRLGSDAPVAPLDPWLAISAAVFRTGSSDRPAFEPEQCLDVRTALAASTARGRDRLYVGDPADLVLLDRDPYAADTPEAMHAMRKFVAATMLAGRLTWCKL